MTKPTNDEKAMAERLDAITAQVEQERARLHLVGRCTCKRDGSLCALHADVDGLLADAVRKLRYASGRLASES